MARTPYNKPALSLQQQIQQLKARGLKVADDSKAIALLERISYYRLSGYWYPLLADKQSHIFKPTAEFETAFQLYCFDRKLRQLVAAELEKIEVAIRSKMIYQLSHAWGAFWFQDPTHFRNPVKHADTLSKIGAEYARSDEEFIAAFRAKYSNPLPPAWMIMEVTSFGALSILYQKLAPGREKRAVAAAFGLPDGVFETWLHSIVYLRNVCAHHARLWNRPMNITAQWPRSPRLTWLANSQVSTTRVYFMLSMVLYLLQTVNNRNTFAAKVKMLLAAYPNVDVRAIGFPVGWESEILWKAV